MRRAAATLLGCCLLLNACALPPAEEGVPLPAARAAPAPAGNERAVRRHLAREDRQGLLARHLAETRKLIAAPPTLGNQAHLLVDGPQTQKAMLRAIADARRQIDLETYLLEPAGIGEELATLLAAKRAAKVNIRVLYDSVGSIATPEAYFDRLRADGIAVCAFNPVNPLEADQRLSLNNRDHRKILVVDQQVAFTGGINISGVYSSAPFRRRNTPPSVTAGWRDTHVTVRGPAVGQFQALFDASWQSQGCPPGATSTAAPQPAAGSGGMAVQVVAADPLAERSELYFALLATIGNARQRIWLTYGYFVPDMRILRALGEAARRGVDVRLMLPGFSDFWAPLHAGRARYADLLAAGVRIFEYRDALLHAKTAVIDGVWSSVGSTNLDWRSFVHNYEADLLVLDGDFAGEMEELFAFDQDHAHEITAREWAQRSLFDRLREWLALRWEYLL
ncbi:MAG TPA: phospholipase D-like domain-containing protein [Azonexus sp.]